MLDVRRVSRFLPAGISDPPHGSRVRTSCSRSWDFRASRGPTKPEEPLPTESSHRPPAGPLDLGPIRPRRDLFSALLAMFILVWAGSRTNALNPFVMARGFDIHPALVIVPFTRDQRG